MARRAVSPADVDLRRTALLDAAMAVFRTEGTDATVAAIAQAAGVAKGSFYTYFASKEHLVVALRNRYVEDLVGLALEIFARVGHEDIVELADEIVATSVDFDIANRDVLKIIRSSGGDAVADLAEANRRIHEMVAAGIRVGVAAGRFEVADPWLTAGLLNHAIHGFVEEIVVQDADIDRDALVDAAQTLVRRALMPGG